METFPTLRFSNLFCVSECKFNEIAKSDLINTGMFIFCDEYTKLCEHSSNLLHGFIEKLEFDQHIYLSAKNKTFVVNCKRIMEYSMDMGE